MDYRLHQKGEREYLTFPGFDKLLGVTALFTTRRGGVSKGCCATWNFGAHELDAPENIRENFRLLADVLEIPEDHMVRTSQTHTTNIRIVTKDDMGKGITRERDYDDIDGLMTNVPGIALITGHADCNAVFFYDPVKKVIAMVHSGWRGTLGGISKNCADMMKEQFGCRAQDIYVGIGPALCQDCFEVDEDVALAFFSKNGKYAEFAEQKGKKYYLHLKEIIKEDLDAEGFDREKIFDMGLCTKCRGDLFFSHRGQKGKRGIMAAAILLTGEDSAEKPAEDPADGE